MKEIATRLHENRQIQLAKEILESNGYTVSKRKLSEESTEKTYYINYLERKGKFKGNYVHKSYKASSKEEAEEKFNVEHPYVKKYDYKVVGPDDLPESHGYKVSKRSESIKESSTGDWIHWEMPADYEGPFEYPHYYKKYSEDIIGYVYLPYKSSNPDRVDSISGYRADLYDNRKTDSIAQKNFRTLKAAQDYLDQMYKQHSGYKVSKRVKESKPSTAKESQDTQYGVHQFSTGSIIFRGTEEECGRYIDKRKDLWDDAEVYMMTPDDPHYIKESQNTVYVQSEIYVGDTFDVRDSHGEEYETTIKNIYIEDLQSDDPEVFIKHEWTSKKDGRTGTSTHTLGVFKRDFLGIY